MTRRIREPRHVIGVQKFRHCTRTLATCVPDWVVIHRLVSGQRDLLTSLPCQCELFEAVVLLTEAGRSACDTAEIIGINDRLVNRYRQRSRA